MAGIKLQKRDHDFFVSYGHADLNQVANVVRLLQAAGLRLWFDRTDGNAAKRSSELLASSIGNARGVMIFVTQHWKASTWCRSEYEVALNEQRANDGFEIVCVRVDEVDAPAWLQTSEIVDLRELIPASFARLLRSLSSDVPKRFDNLHDVYLAAPWSRQTSRSRLAFEQLSHIGWRLIGDAPNLKHLGEKRVEEIIRTTRGLIAVLPYDQSYPEYCTSPYILEEARLAVGLQKPLLILAEPDVVVPPDLVAASHRRMSFLLSDTSSSIEQLQGLLEGFDDVLQRVPHDERGAMIFLASSLQQDEGHAADVVSVIERASNMKCVRGERLPGDNVQEAIISLIRKSALVIADVTSDNKNTLIEAGIAMGAGTRIKLMCYAPRKKAFPKKRFMFEGQEYFWYRDGIEQLSLCYFFARQLRRRVYVVH